MISTRSEIQKILDTEAGAQDFLDNYVHDEASCMASGINNDGLKAQLEFLNQRGMTDEGVLENLKMAVER